MSEKTEARLALEARAEAVNLDYPWNIGDAKLEERVVEAEAAIAASAIPEALTAAREAVGEDTPPAAPEAQAEVITPAAQVTTDISRTEEVVLVRGPKKGRYRCGRHFAREWTSIPVSELTEDELTALAGDPALTVKLAD